MFCSTKDRQNVSIEGKRASRQDLYLAVTLRAVDVIVNARFTRDETRAALYDTVYCPGSPQGTRCNTSCLFSGINPAAGFSMCFLPFKDQASAGRVKTARMRQTSANTMELLTNSGTLQEQHA